MSDAVQVSVAKAVASLLEAATFSQPIEVSRNYGEQDATLQLEEPSPNYVDVVAVTTKQTADLSARSKLKLDVPIDIALRRKFPAAEQDTQTGAIVVDDIDGLAFLFEEMFLAFVKVSLPAFDSAIWQTTEITVVPDLKQLREWRQFTGVIRVTFRVDKEV